jgi:hypothetical protein
MMKETPLSWGLVNACTNWVAFQRQKFCPKIQRGSNSASFTGIIKYTQKTAHKPKLQTKKTANSRGL